MNGGKQFIFEQQQLTRCFLNKQSLFLGKRRIPSHILPSIPGLKTLVRPYYMILVNSLCLNNNHTSISQAL